MYIYLKRKKRTRIRFLRNEQISQRTVHNACVKRSFGELYDIFFLGAYKVVRII